MAWKWKPIDENTVVNGVDISLNGQLEVVFEVYDDANALVMTDTYTMDSGQTKATAVTAINNRVKRIRDVRALAASVRADVTSGAVVTVPV